ncbi:MAG TPA: hypothetical protein VFB67_00535, partial [Candidatus Polarisedimenticolaceae bacterium]|nr:hypothetical protein [Candidatus Polarisedimenticolaceae bacterium]
ILVPTGATYDATAHDKLLCDNLGNLPGWSGSFGVWRQASFDLSPFAGKEIKLDTHFSTDPLTNRPGFSMDDVQVTNAMQIDCDGQSPTCAPLPPEVSPPGAAVPFTIDKSGPKLGLKLDLRFSESDGATQYEVYAGSLAALASGRYDHAAIAGLCDFTDGTVGDGSVIATVPAATVPDGSYLLAVGRSAAGESKYGASSAGGEIPLALLACP